VQPVACGPAVAQLHTPADVTRPAPQPASPQTCPAASSYSTSFACAASAGALPSCRTPAGTPPSHPTRCHLAHGSSRSETTANNRIQQSTTKISAIAHKRICTGRENYCRLSSPKIAIRVLLHDRGTAGALAAVHCGLTPNCAYPGQKCCILVQPQDHIHIIEQHQAGQRGICSIIQTAGDT
jgi:hypothetical protein